MLLFEETKELMMKMDRYEQISQRIVFIAITSLMIISCVFLTLSKGLYVYSLHWVPEALDTQDLSASKSSDAQVFYINVGFT